MIFNTAWFLVFFAAFYPLLWVVPGKKLRFFFVLAASAVFHTHFAGPAGVAPIIVMAVLTWLIAFKVEKAEGKHRGQWLALALTIPVLGLVYYKYQPFLAGSLVAAWPGAQAWLGAALGPRPMPLAISFFTFEFVHYLTDVYHGKGTIKSPWKFALFCIYFPSIVSGPIKRYEEFCAQVDDGIEAPWKAPEAMQGLAQVLTGFFKKMVVADNVTAFIGLMEARDEWKGAQVLLLMALLSLRILFDFSGYSDIAIGLSRMVGLRLPENFNYPYAALNIQDFWRRWHMSLSSWIRDYVYIPLGGSHHGAARRIFNGLFAMALCGLWHGAAWNYVVWGIYHGAGLAFHGAWTGRFGTAQSLGMKAAAWCLTMAFVAYGWLLFFYPLQKVAFFSAKLFVF